MARRPPCDGVADFIAVIVARGSFDTLIALVARAARSRSRS
jgi:hypothetical protein